MSLPIGYDNFRELVIRKMGFVDKSLFIKDIFDDESAQVSVITRPRRFGKTLNLSMLQHFLSNIVDGQPTVGLFDNLKIVALGDIYMQHQGKYPVIFLTLKKIKADEFGKAYPIFVKLMRDLYLNYQFLLSSSALSDFDKSSFRQIIERTGRLEDVVDALADLTKYLYLHYGVKPWVLIDEYDTPIQSAYLHDYYKEMIAFMRSVFGSALKTNPYLNRGVITGILRISKESLFSDVNNLEVYSILRSEYGQYFGFVEEEVDALLEKTKLATSSKKIKSWYNGYQIGDVTVYNPWSVDNCIKQNGKLKTYWVNTSGNELIRDLLLNASHEFKEQFELLLQDKSIECCIDEDIVFGDLESQDDITDESAIWSLFLMSGYLKPTSQKEIDDETYFTLSIPNKEVKTLYQKIIKQWLSGGRGIHWYKVFLDKLLTGNMIEFEKDLEKLMKGIASHHDASHSAESFYHGFMIGITASLYHDKSYELQSNRESGYGRYDYLILSLDKSKPTIILEFKKVLKSKSPEKLADRLEKAAQEALNQISQKEYLTTALDRGYTNILKIGMAFSGKHFKLAYEQSKG